MSDNRAGNVEKLRRSLPRWAPARIAIGILLLWGGVLGFLPVLGFWMIPLGLMVLAIDIPQVRRARRRLAVRYGRWRAARRGERQNRPGREK